jgi:predicted NUDIX family NTP pyrophosphohydrolase
MKTSAGILLYRWSGRPNAEPLDLFAPKPAAVSAGGRALEVLLVHPGGPFWAKKDAGAWSVPKGEYGDDEDARATARREFAEELGVNLPEGELLPLGDIKQKGGKVITAWAVEGDVDASAARSNTFEMEYPPRSGRMQSFPEVDRAEWFGIDAARGKINPAQAAFLDRLLELLG